MTPISWSELSLAKQIFTVVVGTTALGGFGYVMFHDWKKSHWLVKVVAIFFTLVILAIAASTLIRG